MVRQAKRPSDASSSSRTKMSRTKPTGYGVRTAQDQSGTVSAQAGDLAGDAFRVKKSTTELHTCDKRARDRRIRRRTIALPELVIKKSLVPEGGRGVFAEENIKCGQWVTEYGGEVISNDAAGQRRRNGEDTHIRSAGFMDQCIDSRIRGEWSFDYYTRYSSHPQPEFLESTSSIKDYSSSYGVRPTNIHHALWKPHTLLILGSELRNQLSDK